jgi:hypothetical protein
MSIEAIINKIRNLLLEWSGQLIFLVESMGLWLSYRRPLHLLHHFDAEQI